MLKLTDVSHVNPGYPVTCFMDRTERHAVTSVFREPSTRS